MADLTGKKFNRWTVVEQSSEKYRGQIKWKCICQCGTTRNVVGSQLICGRSKSCGCLRSDSAVRMWTKHGHSPSSGSSKMYMRWRSMLDRCNNPKCRAYKDYGGRGIGVCSRWLVFENFLADMGKIPFPTAEIDRIDNDGDYEPENCRWVTRKENTLNSRQARMVTIDGTTKCFKDWCKHFGITPGSAYERLRKGWSVVDALSKPKNSRNPAYN